MHFFVKVVVPGLCKKFLAGINPQPNNPSADLPQFITGALEYTYKYRAVFYK